MQNGNDSRRASLQSSFLRSLEDYIDQVVIQNHGTKKEDVPRIVKDHFDRAIQANIQYHDSMSHAFEKDSENPQAIHHKLIADTYRLLLSR